MMFEPNIWHFPSVYQKKKIVHFLPQVHVPQYTMMCKKNKKNNTISIKCLDPLLYYIPPVISLAPSRIPVILYNLCVEVPIKISMLLFVVPCKCLTNLSNICGNSIFYTDVETSV